MALVLSEEDPDCYPATDRLMAGRAELYRTVARGCIATAARGGPADPHTLEWAQRVMARHPQPEAAQ